MTPCRSLIHLFLDFWIEAVDQNVPVPTLPPPMIDYLPTVPDLTTSRPTQNEIVFRRMCFKPLA